MYIAGEIMKKLLLMLVVASVYINYIVYVTGFAKTILKGTFCISRNINLKY